MATLTTAIPTTTAIPMRSSTAPVHTSRENPRLSKAGTGASAHSLLGSAGEPIKPQPASYKLHY